MQKATIIIPIAFSLYDNNCHYHQSYPSTRKSIKYKIKTIIIPTLFLLYTWSLLPLSGVLIYPVRFLVTAGSVRNLYTFLSHIAWMKNGPEQKTGAYPFPSYSDSPLPHSLLNRDTFNLPNCPFFSPSIPSTLAYKLQSLCHQFSMLLVRHRYFFQLSSPPPQYLLAALIAFPLPERLETDL